jgi:hypothetical protein
MLQKYYFATFVWVWSLVSHTKETATESSQAAEEGVDLNEGGSSGGVQKQCFYWPDDDRGWDDELDGVCGTRGIVQKGIDGFGVRT